MILLTGYCGDASSAPPTGAAAGDAPISLVLQCGDAGDSGAFSPDGRLLVTGGHSSDTILWEVSSGRELRRLAARNARHLGFLPGGRRVWTNNDSDRTQIFEVETGRELKSVDWGSPAAPSSDGRRMLVGGPKESGTISLRENSSGRILRQFRGHTRYISSLAMSADGRFSVSSSADETIRLWDTASGRELRRLDSPCWGGAEVAISPDSRLVLSTCKDGPTRLWEASSGRLLSGTMGEKDSGPVFSPDDQLVAACHADGAGIWEIPSGRLLRRLGPRAGSCEYVAWTPDGRQLHVGTSEGIRQVWDAHAGTQLQSLNPGAVELRKVVVSPDGRRVLVDDGRSIRVLDLRAGRQVHRFQGSLEKDWTSDMIVSPDGRFVVAAFSGSNAVRAWNSSSGALESELKTEGTAQLSADGMLVLDGLQLLDSVKRNQRIREVSTGKLVLETDGRAQLSADGRVVADSFKQEGTSLTGVRIREVSTGRLMCRLMFPPATFASVQLSPDGRFLLAYPDASDNVAHPLDRSPYVTALFEVNGGRELYRWRLGRPYGGVFLADGRLMLSVDGFGPQAGYYFLDLTTGKHPGLVVQPGNVTAVGAAPDRSFLAFGGSRGRIWQMRANARDFIPWPTGHQDDVDAIAFSPDGRWMLTLTSYRTLRFVHVSSRRELCRMAFSDDGSWVVSAPDGRFDSNNLEEIRSLHWVAGDEPLRALPLELFMRQYYEPRLLSRLLAGEQLKPVPSITSLNRAQPRVRITRIDREPGRSDEVSVTVEVASTRRQYIRGGRQLSETSGVYNLRLFRDGQLVGYLPPDDGPVPLAPGSEAATSTFHHIRLNSALETTAVRFSAYAFNSDRIKSATSSLELPVERGERRERRAFLISMGVNATESPVWKLKYAANDARRVQESLGDSLERSGVYQEVVRIPLLSDFRMENEARVVGERTATRENLKTVLALLAGREVDPQRRREVPNWEKLRQARPEDLVLLTISSHGFTDANGRYFFLPFDIGTDAPRNISPALATRSISSDDLASWVRDIDAGDFALIIDACYSAALVESSDFKPGPLGSRGLGQLAYEKGMAILVAAQADRVATEHREAGMGLLTFALIQEGLEQRLADRMPPDGEIDLTEWLSFAVDRVPVLSEAVEGGTWPDGSGTAPRQVDPEALDASTPMYQHPGLFDFRRDARESLVSRIR